MAPPDEDAFSSGLPIPKDVRLAVGELDGEAGDDETRLRRLAAASAAGPPGESQKKEPSPGDPSTDAGPLNVKGDCGTLNNLEPLAALVDGLQGESMSISSSSSEREEQADKELVGRLGSVYDVSDEQISRTYVSMSDRWSEQSLWRWELIGRVGFRPLRWETAPSQTGS